MTSPAPSIQFKRVRQRGDTVCGDVSSLTARKPISEATKRRSTVSNPIAASKTIDPSIHANRPYTIRPSPLGITYVVSMGLDLGISVTRGAV